MQHYYNENKSPDTLNFYFNDIEKHIGKCHFKITKENESIKSKSIGNDNICIDMLIIHLINT